MFCHFSLYDTFFALVDGIGYMQSSWAAEIEVTLNGCL